MLCVYPAPWLLAASDYAGSLFPALIKITCKSLIRNYPLSAVRFRRFLAASAAAGQILPPFLCRQPFTRLPYFSIGAAARPALNASLKVLKVLKKIDTPPALIFQGFQKSFANRKVSIC